MKILCTPKLTSKQIAWLDEVAASRKITREEVIRCAVLYYSKFCVPTQKAEQSK